jgi:mannose/fructose/N-acetylgalactosamine-specific phosphotransferase system component IIC
VLSKYLGLNITAIALIALVVALLGFKRSKEIFDSKSKLAAAGTTNEGDDFYG